MACSCARWALPLLLFFSFVCLSNCSAYERKFVQLVTRHGDRTPLNVLPNDQVTWECPQSILSFPDSTSSASLPARRLYRRTHLKQASGHTLLGNCSMGQLTHRGCMQHHLLGKRLRKRYIETEHPFLPDVYDPEVVHLRSTNIERTIQSAECQALGLYPPIPTDSGVPVLEIETAPMTSNDDLLPSFSRCPRLLELRREISRSSAWKASMATMHDLKARLCDTWGIPEHRFPGWVAVFDQMSCRAAHGKHPPGGLTHEERERVEAHASRHLHFLFGNETYNTLAAGPLVQHLLHNLRQAAAGATPRRFTLLSAHDSTVASLLFALGIYDERWPPYAANVALELYADKSTGQNHVQILYNGAVAIPPPCRGQASGMCPLGQLEEYLGRLIPADYRKACREPFREPLDDF